MCDYVDRSVAMVQPGARLVVRATRGWLAAMAARTYSPSTVAPLPAALAALAGSFADAGLGLGIAARRGQVHE